MASLRVGHAVANPASQEPQTSTRLRESTFTVISHLVENAFARIKQWRGSATRYAKNTASFAAAINIWLLFIWLKIS